MSDTRTCPLCGAPEKSHYAETIVFTCHTFINNSQPVVGVAQSPGCRIAQLERENDERRARVAELEAELALLAEYLPTLQDETLAAPNMVVCTPDGTEGRVVYTAGEYEVWDDQGRAVANIEECCREGGEA